MIRPAHLTATLALVLCVGCDGPEGPVVDAGGLDTAPPDAATPAVLWAAGDLAVSLDPEGVRAQVRWDGAVALEGVTVGFEAADERWTTADWPERTWTTGADWAEGRFTGAPGLPVLVWRLAAQGAALQSTVRFEGAGSRVVVDRVDTLRARVEGDRALAGDGTGWAPRAAAALAPFQRLLGGSVSLAISAPLGTVDLTDGLRVSPRGPRDGINPADTLTLPSVTVRFSTDWPAWPAESGATPASGWRSGAWGSAVSGALVRRQGEALEALGLSSQDALLLLDGLWYAGPGDWRPGLVFPGGLAGLRAAVAPARLAFRWPALHVAADDPLPSERPEARMPDAPGRCAEPGCVPLNPALPAVRAHAARAISAFADDAAVYLSDLPDAAEVGRGARETLLRELAAVAPDLELLGETDDDAPAWPGFEATDPCRAAADTHPWPAQCAGHLSGASARRPGAPSGLTAERALAWALVQAGPRAVDPGPIRLAERAPGAQRIALTLAALSGGPRLLGDDLTLLSAPDAEAVARLWALPGARGQPLDAGTDGPPSTWQAPGLWAGVNWGDAPVSLAPPPGRWATVWGPDPAGGLVLVEPGDAVLLEATDTSAVVGSGSNRVEIEP